MSDTPYRNGDDPELPSQLEGSQTSDDNAAQNTPNEVDPALRDIETAVLLVVTSEGNVLPVVNIDNLQMKRIASPREVYRICLDAADQLSSVSLLGEIVNVFTTVQREGSKFTAQQIAELLIRVQQAKASGD